MGQAAQRPATPQRLRLGPGLALPRTSGCHALCHTWASSCSVVPASQPPWPRNGSASHRQPPAAACCCYPAVLLPTRSPSLTCGCLCFAGSFLIRTYLGTISVPRFDFGLYLPSFPGHLHNPELLVSSFFNS